MKKTFTSILLLCLLVLTGCSNAQPHKDSHAHGAESHQFKHQSLSKAGDKGYVKDRGDVELLATSDKQIVRNTSNIIYTITQVKIVKNTPKTKQQKLNLDATFGDDWTSPIYYVQVDYSLKNNTGKSVFIWGAGGIDNNGEEHEVNKGAYDSLSGKRLQPDSKMNGLLLYKTTSTDIDNLKNEKMVTGMVDVQLSKHDLDYIDPETINLFK